jgi:dipeptidyl aminopeptidase/acylaminoacyl peptidase
MLMPKIFRNATTVALICLLFNQPLLAFAQQSASSRSTTPAATLTVRDIMAEPSIAGARPEGEKLSPNGQRAAYLWSASALEARDLYVVSTGGGEPKLLVRGVDKAQEPQAGKTTETHNEARTDERKEERAMQRDAVQQAREQSVGGLEWSNDSRRLLFSKGGDLYVLDVDDKIPAPRRLTRTAAVEAGARWLDEARVNKEAEDTFVQSHRILYQSGGNLFVVDADQAGLVQLTREGGAAFSGKIESNAGGQQGGGAQQGSTSQQGSSAQQGGAGLSVSIAKAANDGAHIAYLVSDNSKQRALFVPDYTGEFVTAPTVRRGWSEQRVQVIASDGTTERAVVVKLPAPEGVSYIRGFDWLPDNSTLVIDRIDRDTKRRQIFTANANDGIASLVQEETDAKWVAPLSRIVEVSPQNNALLYASEESGFNHLYLLPLARDERNQIVARADAQATTNTQKPRSAQEAAAMEAATVGQSVPNMPVSQAAFLPRARQLTSGDWEVNWAKWMPDGERIIFSSTQASTAERMFYYYELRNGKTVPLPVEHGLNTDAQLSKTGGILLFQHSEWNAPNELYALKVCPGCRGQTFPNRLTNTVPARFREISWTRPQFVDYAAKDGAIVKARVYTPPNFDKTKKYPAVVFVHGAGYLQNVVNGWNNYYREAMFDHVLATRGYVVLDVDYRGSLGYGREWRTDVYDFLGGLDLQDELDGIDYVVKNFGVDAKRVGMYGGSYGGFMAEMAAMRAPERIACAAALRPVADWKNYYASSPVYTAERLGFPDKNKEAYRRSSPITYAEKLQRPLLILHGMVDDNVHFQDSVQLIEKLIELGKTPYFEAMFYPKENHSFTHAASWTDEYERILAFFDRHLK